MDLSNAKEAVKEIYRMLKVNITQESYNTIMELFLLHCDSEGKFDEAINLKHDPTAAEKHLNDLISTLTDDCVYTLPDGQKWSGKTEVKAFYYQLISSFENMVWHPQSLVVGPQGVLDVIKSTAIQKKPFFNS